MKKDKGIADDDDDSSGGGGAGGVIDASGVGSGSQISIRRIGYGGGSGHCDGNEETECDDENSCGAVNFKEDRVYGPLNCFLPRVFKF